MKEEIKKIGEKEFYYYYYKNCEEYNKLVKFHKEVEPFQCWDSKRKVFIFKRRYEE